jgi:hypothetical protein
MNPLRASSGFLRSKSPSPLPSPGVPGEGAARNDGRAPCAVFGAAAEGVPLCGEPRLCPRSRYAGTPGEGWGEGDLKHRASLVLKITLILAFSRTTGRRDQTSLAAIKSYISAKIVSNQPRSSYLPGAAQLKAGGRSVNGSTSNFVSTAFPINRASAKSSNASQSCALCACGPWR